MTNPPSLIDNIDQPNLGGRFGPKLLPSPGSIGLGLLVSRPEGGWDGRAGFVVRGRPADDLGIEVILRQGLGTEDVGLVAAVTAAQAQAMGGRGEGHRGGVGRRWRGATCSSGGSGIGGLGDGSALLLLPGGIDVLLVVSNEDAHRGTAVGQ